ncbi:SGNH/GDSL hydrolase family protein [Leptospira congkakensis]|uniref:SGNH/GDSL hydrolase family protein n=2 Tax=Leptospira congkakensis TaxID=2484932 RepID=A0A4Z1AF77_9LEPT|nr:SGNH/GDSL hydrolase family protein [Leptospira congkakensis]TGL88823.1 SGNH/GDSL hydrolase family protein [Leptospira congkakensis]TGL89330.1 SGNH/GDSL hydrolase family protein [Leptospira congkakensis]TGL97299.1 SGNH/GDSL hydrolase family protein [Leptospira congkakensis]
MKKEIHLSTFPFKSIKIGLYAFFFLCGLVLVTRTIDTFEILRFPYGHYHFPPVRKIPYFRQGEREFGEINEYGFRIGSVKENTNCKYLLLGDSQTFGSGIFWKDSFPEILNRETNCQWINTGIPGFTLENEFSLYEKVSQKLDFDKVYLIVYGNDIYETGDTPDYLHFVNHKSWYVHFVSFFFPEHTRRFIKNKYFESIQIRMEEELDRVSKLPYMAPDSKAKKIEVVDFNSLKTLFQISPTYLPSSLDTKTSAKVNFDRWKKVFYQLKHKIEQSNKSLTVVYIPLEVEYDKSRFFVYESIGFQMNPSWLESDSELFLDLFQLTKENNIPLIDLRKFMRYRTDLLQSGDIHLNENATRLIADILKRDL